MAQVLVVDDDEKNRELLADVLTEEGYTVTLASDGAECLQRCREGDVGTVLLDVRMPGVDGLSVCRALKADPSTGLLPVILVTAYGDRTARVQGLEAGADDFLTKPVDREELVPRVRSALRTHRLVRQTSTVFALAITLTSALEARDPYTHQHSGRVAASALRTAEAMGVGPAHRRDVFLAGLLHDVGKVGIRDAILLKPGPLTAEEYRIVKTHAAIGERICFNTPGLEVIAPIVAAHHERWDGGGYPKGLRGAAVPFLSRIVSVADAFDAMTSTRPYHAAMSVSEACEEVRRCRGTQFDPVVADEFLRVEAYRIQPGDGDPQNLFGVLDL
jgi:putative two-component system response regulator